MAPKLYMTLASPPVRAVLSCAKHLGIELDLIEVNIFDDEHLKPEFLKLNPQHTVPVLDDDGFVIWDSHVIMPYLVSKYSKGNSLYPEDIKKRAVIDQRLHFNCSTLLAPHLKVANGIWRDRIKTVTEEHSAPILSAFDVLEIFLQKTKYVAGNELTIADFGVWPAITNISTYLPVDEKKYPKITSWLKLMDKLPFSGKNKEGAELLRAFIQTKLSPK